MPVQQIRNDKTQKLWFNEVDALYKGKTTGKEYTRYNLAFIKWFKQEYGN